MSNVITTPISEPRAMGQDDHTKDEVISGEPDAITITTKDAEPTDKQVSLLPTPQNNPDDVKYSIFTTNEKRAIVFAAAASSFFSPLSSQIYFPALETLASDLHITFSQANLTVTTYMIVQAIAPMFVGSLADSAGRRPAFVLCFVIYIGSCIGCALAPNYAALLVLRAVQSAGSSPTISLSQAVVSDIVTSAERGSYVALTAVPVILAPSIGPVIGGVISQFLGWRWIFWILAIACGVVLFFFLIFMPETCRILVGDGSIRPHLFYRTIWQAAKDSRQEKKRAMRDAEGGNLGVHDNDAYGRPEGAKKSLTFKKPDLTRTLKIISEKEMFTLLMYSSLIYAGFYAVATAIPAQFSSLYGFDGLRIGLVYLPLGGGSIVAIPITGRLSNWNYQRYCRKLGIPYDRSRQQSMAGFPIERARLEPCLPFLVLFTVTMIGFGWAVQAKAHLAVNFVLLFLIGLCIIVFSNMLSTLIVDLNPGVAGSATAASNLTRGLVGAGASALINPLMDAVGAGWAFTIVGLSYVVFFPALWLVLKNGVKWREARAKKDELKKQQQEDEKSTENRPS